MAVGTLAPLAKQQFLDATGRPLSGGRLYSYASGTTSPLATYTDASLSVANQNPVVLDAAGRCTLYMGPYAYKLVLKDASDVQQWTQDVVVPPAPYNVDLDIPCVAGESIAAGNVIFLSDGSGGRTAGRWYKTDADDTATSSLAAMIGMAPAAIALGATGLVRLQGRMTDLAGLSPGAVYYVSATAGALTSSVPANARLVGVADSTTSLVLFGAAVGNTVTVSEIGFTPLASTGASGDIVATINATTEGIRIDAGLIEINADVTFASGYDPTGKVPATGAAADVNANTTTISGSKIRAGSLESNNWGASAGAQFNLVDGTFKLGGSSAPKLAWDGSTLSVTGAITVTGGNAETTTGSQAKADAAQSAAIAASSSDATAKANAAAAASLAKAAYLYNGGSGYTTLDGSKVQPGTIQASNLIAGTVTGWILTGSTIYGGSGQEVILDTTGIRITASDSGLYSDSHALRFVSAGGSSSGFGVGASESTDHLRRGVFLEAVNIGSGSRSGFLYFVAQGGSNVATFTLDSAGYASGPKAELVTGKCVLDARPYGTTIYGDVVPGTTATDTLGAYDKKWLNINLALDANTAPSYVVVNKGGVGADSGSALGYLAGYTGAFAVAGVGTLTFKAGVLASVS